jgi:thymidylate synthase ThyX
MYAKVDLKNLFGFLRLRCDSHAQIEIRQYANVMAGIVKELFPIAYEAWEDYNFLSSPLSHLDKQLLSYMMCFRISIEDIERKEDIKKIIEDKYKTIGMSGREYGEFIAKVSPSDRPEFDLSSALLYDLVDKE